jgi:homoserine kinase type II
MAVLTKIPEAELKKVLEDNYFGLLPIRKITGILEGVENTNYKINAESGDYIFTLIERRLDLQGLQRCLELMYHMHYNRIPCPLPVYQVNDRKVTAHIHFGKPACVVTFMPGKSLGETAMHLEQFYALGAVCARINSSGLGAAVGMPINPLGKDGILALAETLQGNFGENDTLVNGVIAALKQADFKQLETGLCHGDLFPDNVFYEGNAISGVIDWYFACMDTLAYDLAIVLSAWCFRPGQETKWSENAEKYIIEGYDSVRKLTPEERAALPLLCQLAALRFYLTRLQDSLTQRKGALIDKDPNEYANKLRFFSTWPGI